MRRHLIAGAFACFGSSLFGQTITNPANQPQRALNNAQNTIQSGLQNAKNSLNKTVPQFYDNSVLDNGQNRSSLNAQGQVSGSNRTVGGAGIQGNINSRNDANLRNNSNSQFGQTDLNSSTQLQTQQTLRSSQNRSNMGQAQTQYSSDESWQNSGRAQNQPNMQFDNRMSDGGFRQPSQMNNNGIVYTLRKDVYGREYICVNGRSVYFDNADSTSSRGNSATGVQYRAGYGNYDLQNGQSPSSQFTPVDRFDDHANTFHGNENNDGSQSPQYQGQQMRSTPLHSSHNQSNGTTHTLRTDANGREFICINGRPVYFDNAYSSSEQANLGNKNQYRVEGYRDVNLQNNQNWAPPPPNNDQRAGNQQPKGSIQSSVDDRRDSRSVVDPAESKKQFDGGNDTSLPVDRLDNQRLNEPNWTQTDAAPTKDSVQGSDVTTPTDPSSQKADLPKR